MLTTPRLRLRLWRPEDLEPYAALNADPRVREFFPSVLSHQESADSMEQISDYIGRRGFGLWAVEEHWGHGYATEGSRAALAFGFSTVGLQEIVAMIATGNGRSRRVAERLGMSRDPSDDFDHPKIAAGHPLRRHVLYRLTAGASKLNG